MNPENMLKAMQGATDFEPAGDQPIKEAEALKGCVSHVMAGQRHMPVLKAMNTTACERGCFYCPFRAGRSQTKRVTFKPDDLAKGFVALHEVGMVEGLFLSSGIINGGVTTQDKILDTATILRKKYQFKGFIHLKIMPGAEYDQVQAAMRLANRVSINLEAPSQEHLQKLAPGKNFYDELLIRLEWIEKLRQQGERASSVTQFVVGPAGERDVDILSLTDQLYNRLGLSRTYFSAFHPVEHTPLDNMPSTDPMRQNRLYQASYLLRDYGFSAEEMPFDQAGNLPLGIDPKKAWADVNLQHTPIEINLADKATLMRIPGIGAQGADQIMQARRQGRLRNLTELRKIGVRQPDRAAPYILLDGHAPASQLKLF